MARDPARLMPIETYVRETKPSRIFPPGEVPSYCNYCVTLEGYIVQRVSGEKFDDYLDKHIFQPLGMNNSTFRQPLPEQFKEQMATGYNVASGPPGYFELVGPAPAGSIATTGADMGRFMIAWMHAFNGTESPLLGHEAAQRMQTTMLRAVPPTQGMAVGFFERDRNGHRVREHGGDTQFFHSRLAMFMDDDVGIFMSFNSSGKDGAVYKIREDLFAAFADRYFPAQTPEIAKAPEAAAHAQLVSGRYASSRRAESRSSSCSRCSASRTSRRRRRACSQCLASTASTVNRGNIAKSRPSSGATAPLRTNWAQRWTASACRC